MGERIQIETRVFLLPLGTFVAAALLTLASPANGQTGLIRAFKIDAGDLTLTFGANSIVLKQAFVAEHDGFAWSRKQNRVGDLTWRTTVPFSSGAPTAVATRMMRLWT